MPYDLIPRNAQSMTTLTITSKGQVTFRKELLRHLDSRPGDQLDVSLLPGGRLEVKAAPSGRIESIFGLLSGKARKAASIEEIRNAAAEGWAGKQR
jgi:antitoxin PrlF